MLIVILASLAAGVCFAASGVLQQQEASRQSEDESLSPQLVLSLLRRPAWLAGIGLAALSYAFKALALAFGALSIVAPLVATEIIFAIPVSIRRHGKRLRAREWIAAVAVAAGLALGIFSASPQSGNPLPPTLRWVEALGTLVVLSGIALLIGRRLTGSARASLFAFAASALLAAQGALLAATVALFKEGLVTALTSWQPYGMAVASIVGMTLVQSAYQAGPLAASMPVIDAVNPTLAIAIGVVVFGETVQTGTLHLLGTGIGLALLIAGIVMLDTSPLVRRVQREEKEEREEEADRAGAEE